jgi:hypothetical protein
MCLKLTSHGRKVPTVSSHNFNDEDAPFGAGRGLADPVTDLGDFVERGIGAEREIGSGNVVGNGGGKNDNRNLEFGEFASILRQLCSKC